MMRNRLTKPEAILGVADRRSGPRSTTSIARESVWKVLMPNFHWLIYLLFSQHEALIDLWVRKITQPTELGYLEFLILQKSFSSSLLLVTVKNHLNFDIFIISNVQSSQKQTKLTISLIILIIFDF